MPGTNLTRQEAQGRAAIISNVSYDVALDLTLDGERFGSVTTVTFNAEPGAATFADLVDGEISRITLNGTDLDPAAVYADSRITLSDLAAQNTLIVSATCLYSHSGEGLHKFVDVDGLVYLYTQFEVPDARRVFTTFEQPDLKAAFTFSVTAPAHWAVVSNSRTPEPVVDGAVGVWNFDPTYPMSTYITALIAGDYVSVHEVYEGTRGSIDLGIYCRQSVRQYLDADDIFLITKQGFGFFEDAFDMAYPFGDKYDQLFVPEYNMGAMENAGAVTFRDEMIFRSRQTVSAYEQRANTILHEMAHMWFGDLVTMRWWDDLWLNESFAEFAAHHSSVEATRFTDAWTGFTNNRKNWAYRQDQLPSTHPIAADNYDLHAVEANFDGITYAKGASALKQLVAWVGVDDFFAGLRAYFAKHAYGNTELTDLLAELESASGRELSSWAAEWLQTSGVNTLAADFTVDEAGTFTRFDVVQSAIEAYPTLRRHRIAIGLYSLQASGKLVRTQRLEVDVTGERTAIDELVGIAQPDLVLLNDDDLTYAKIRLDQQSLAALVAHIADIESSLARALCWGAAWDMTRDAELPASAFIDLVLAGVGTETDLTAVASLLRQGQTALNQFVADEARGPIAARWESGVRGLLDGAEAGSDHQLAFARAFASACSDPAAVRTVLDAPPAGLTIDADLRWTFVTALARLGVLSESDINSEIALDNTNQGRECGAGALAIRPLDEAKAEAWRRVVEDPSTPNETRRQIASSFQVPGQADVLAPYVAAYLKMAETIIDEQGVWIGQIALIHLFPLPNPTNETLEAVTAWLETSTAPTAATRYVREGKDDLERALRARAVTG
jgi:aminopeptidase N